MTGGAAVTVIYRVRDERFRGTLSRWFTHAPRTFTWDENCAGAEEKPKTTRSISGGDSGRPMRSTRCSSRTGKGRSSEWVSRTHSVPTADFRGGNFNRMRRAHLNVARPADSGSDDRRRDHRNSGRDDSIPFPATKHRPLGVLQRLNAIPQYRSRPDGCWCWFSPNLDGDTDNYFNTATLPLKRYNIDAKVNWSEPEWNRFGSSTLSPKSRRLPGLSALAMPVVKACGGGWSQGPHARAYRWHAPTLSLPTFPDDAVRRQAPHLRHQFRIGHPGHSGDQRPQSARKRHAVLRYVRAIRRLGTMRAGSPLPQ